MALISTLVIAILCFMPASVMPDQDFYYEDKLHHLVAFAGLSFLWMAYKNAYVPVLAGLIFFAFFIEAVQHILPASFNRALDYYDVLADTIGIFCGFAFCRIYNFLVKSLYP